MWVWDRAQSFKVDTSSSQTTPQMFCYRENPDKLLLACRQVATNTTTINMSTAEECVRQRTICPFPSPTSPPHLHTITTFQNTLSGKSWTVDLHVPSELWLYKTQSVSPDSPTLQFLTMDSIEWVLHQMWCFLILPPSSHSPPIKYFWKKSPKNGTDEGNL